VSADRQDMPTRIPLVLLTRADELLVAIQADPTAWARYFSYRKPSKTAVVRLALSIGLDELASAAQGRPVMREILAASDECGGEG
tara:strand:+ start:592 stop:846 length:255 start_codon:yes stop_codon:yes gene_type:complete